MSITIDLPDDLAKELQGREAEIPRILQLGMREWQARRETGYGGLSGILEKLAALPSPEEILALRPAPALEGRLEFLLKKSKTVGLSAEDQQEWNDYEYVEHLVRLAKATALRRLKQAAP